MSDSTLEMRKCKTCGQEKPLSVDFFRIYLRKGRRYMDYQCRSCDSQRAKEWNRKNSQHVSARDREKYWSDPQKARAEGSATYWRTREKRLAHAAVRRNGPEGDHMRALDAEKARRWRAAHPLEAQIGPNKRRALKRSVQVEPVTQKQLDELLAKQKGKCAICKQKLAKKHLDHIKPLKLGGEHGVKNFQYLCPRCNLSKRQHDPIDYMQTRGYLL